MAGIYEVELSDGRIVELESDSEPDEQSILAALGSGQQQPEPAPFSIGQFSEPPIPTNGMERAGRDFYTNQNTDFAPLNRSREVAFAELSQPEREKKFQEETIDAMSPWERTQATLANSARSLREGVGAIPEFLGRTQARITQPMFGPDADEVARAEASLADPNLSEAVKAPIRDWLEIQKPKTYGATLESDPIARGLIETGTGIKEQARRDFPDVVPESRRNLGDDVLEGIAGSAPLAVGGIVGGLPGMIIAGFTAEGQGAYDREIERQKRAGETVDPERAFNKGATVGAVNTAIEAKLGMGRIIRNAKQMFGRDAAEQIADKMAKKGVGQGLKDFAVNRIKDGRAGGLEEFSQSISEQLVVEGNVDLAEAVKSAVVGAISESTYGGGIEAVGRTAQAVNRLTQPQPTTPNAIQPQSPQVPSPLRQEPVQGAAEVPAQGGRTTVDETRGQEVAPEIQQFGQKFKTGERISTNEAIKQGMASRGIADLEALAALRMEATTRTREILGRAEKESNLDAKFELLGEVGKINPQLPREAIEAATNVGGHIEGEGAASMSLGERPLDWRKNPEVADWLKANSERLGITLPAALTQQTPAKGTARETTQEKETARVLTGSPQPAPVLGTSFNPPAGAGPLPPQTPHGQTMGGPVQERDQTGESQSALGGYSYVRQPNETTEAFAKRFADDKVNEIDDTLIANLNRIDQPDVASVTTAEVLSRKLDQFAKSNVAERLRLEGQIRTLASMVKNFKTQAGQSLQAEKMVNEKLGPYLAILSYMDLIRQRFGEKFNPVSTPEGRRLLELAEQAQKAPEGIRRNKVYQEMIDVLNSLEGISAVDLLRDIWYGSVLARAGTMMNVLAGSYATGALFTLSASLASAVTGHPIQAIRIIGQFLGGTYEAALAAKEIVTKGNYTLLPDFAERSENLLSKKKGARKDSLEILWKRGGLTAAYPGVLAFTRRLITALDYIGALGTRDAQLIFTALSQKDQDSLNAIQKRFDKFENSKAERQAKDEMGPNASRAEVLARKREILEEGVAKEAKAGALEIARRVAANAEPRGIPGAIYKMIAKMPFFVRAPAGLGFIRAAMNMVANSAEFFPVIGLVTAGRAELQARWPNGWPAKAFGLDLPVEQRRLVMANQAVGLGIAALMAAMFLGDDDDEGWELSGNWLGLSPNESKALRDKGEKPYAIRLGKKGPWIVYKQLPIAGPLAIIGNMRDQKRFRNKEWSAQSTAEQITSAWLSGLVYIKDLSALSGLTRIFGGEAGRTQQTPETLAKKANMMVAESGGRFATGYIPSLLKEIDEFQDPSLYRPRLKGDVSGFWLRNVPFARRTVGEGPDLNIFGERINVGRPPFRAWVGVEKDGPLWETVGRLTSQGVFPPIPGRTATVVTDAGERRQMTEKEFYDYQGKWGKTFKEFIAERIEQFNEASPEKAQELYDAFRDRFGPKIRSEVTVQPPAPPSAP